MRRYAWLVLVAGACGGRGGAGDDAASPDAGPDLHPPTSCAIPPEGMPVDTSHPDHVVGDGSAASCTEQALAAAVASGGIVTFACGDAPVTITLTQPIVINNVAGADGLGDTVIDGGGKITLSGGGTTQIVRLDACSPPFNNPRCDIFPHPALTVQHLTFTGGHDDSADGGGAIYRRGGALTVIDSQFYDNHCAETGQDTAGGAIRLVQATPALIVGSVIGQPGRGNSCSNGGGIGSLQATPVRIIDTVVDSNTATGNGGNPGNGGNGGGIYHDGTPLELDLCGVRVTHDTGNAFGGGIFYVDDAGSGTVSIVDSELSDDAVPVHPPDPSHGGAAYLQGAQVSIVSSTVANDQAGFAAGLYVNAMNGRGSFDATNLTVAGVGGTALTLEGGLAGTLLTAPVAGNAVGLAGQCTITLANSVFANASNCQTAPSAAAADSFATDPSCGGASVVPDPQLGALQDNGGTTGVRTMAPASTSPLRGAGHGCPSTDARGAARPSEGCTSGADEGS